MTWELKLFRLQRAVVILPLLSGVLLWLLLPVSLLTMRGPIWQSLWTVHVGVQGLAVFVAAAFFAALLSRLSAAKVAGYLLISVFFLVILFARGFLPITARDALLYHLAVPRWWLAAGHITEIPWHEWSHFPLLLSLGYAGFLSNQLELLTGFYHFSFLILSCGVIAAFLYYKTTDPELSLIGALIGFTVPVCLKLAVEPMADHALALYFGSAFLMFIVAIEQRWSDGALYLVGIFLGLALSVKYNAVLAVAFFVLVALLVLQRSNYSPRESLRSVGIFLVVAGIIVSPWLFRNWYATGNPFYPFLGQFFGGTHTPAFLGASKPLDYRTHGYGESWLDILFLPLRVLFEGQDDNQRLFDGRLSPIFLLALVPLLSPPIGERRPLWALCASLFIGLYFVVSFLLFFLLIRYQAPSLLLAVVLAAYGLKLLADRTRLAVRPWVIYGFLALHLVWAGEYANQSWAASGASEYWGSNESVQHFLERRLDEYPLAEFVNSHLPADAQVYLLYTGNRFYYYHRDVRGAYFSAAELISWLHQGADAERLRDLYLEQGFSHLGIHGPRLLETLERSLSDHEKVMWSEFTTRYLERQFVSGNLSLWKIVPKDLK